MPVLVGSNGWHAIYDELSNGTIQATITDNSGRQYVYRQIFRSIDDLTAFIESK